MKQVHTIVTIAISILIIAFSLCHADQEVNQIRYTSYSETMGEFFQPLEEWRGHWPRVSFISPNRIIVAVSSEGYDDPAKRVRIKLPKETGKINIHPACRYYLVGKAGDKTLKVIRKDMKSPPALLMDSAGRVYTLKNKFPLSEMSENLEFHFSGRWDENKEAFFGTPGRFVWLLLRNEKEVWYYKEMK